MSKSKNVHHRVPRGSVFLLVTIGCVGLILGASEPTPTPPPESQPAQNLGLSGGFGQKVEPSGQGSTPSVSSKSNTKTGSSAVEISDHELREWASRGKLAGERHTAAAGLAELGYSAPNSENTLSDEIWERFLAARLECDRRLQRRHEFEKKSNLNHSERPMEWPDWVVESCATECSAYDAHMTASFASIAEEIEATPRDRQEYRAMNYWQAMRGGINNQIARWERLTHQAEQEVDRLTSTQGTSENQRELQSATRWLQMTRSFLASREAARDWLTETAVDNGAPREWFAKY